MRACQTSLANVENPHDLSEQTANLLAEEKQEQERAMPLDQARGCRRERMVLRLWVMMSELLAIILE